MGLGGPLAVRDGQVGSSGHPVTPWGALDCSERVLIRWHPRQRGWTLSSRSVPRLAMGTTWSITMEGAGCHEPQPMQEAPPWVLTRRRSRWAPPPAPRILRWRLRTEPRSHTLRIALVQASHRERPGRVSRWQSRHGRRSCMSGLVSRESRGVASARIAAPRSTLVGDLPVVMDMSMAPRSFGKKVPRSDRLLAGTAGPRALA